MIIDSDGKIHRFPNSRQNPLITGEERRYHTKDGLEYWFDINEQKIVTSNKSIYIFDYMFSVPYCGGNVIILHLDGRAISFCRGNGKMFGLLADLKPDGSGDRYWDVGSIGTLFRHKDRYVARTYYELTNADRFESKEQQEFAMNLITEILQNFVGDWVGVAHGEKQLAEVVITNELKNKLDSGELIK